ncbi:MAG: ATP-dependent RNA helicase DeaD, partial [Planctomycetota bacterium]
MNQRPRTSGGGRPGGRSAKPKKRIDVKDLDPVDEVPDIETFTEWELGDEIQGSIRDMGITKPTPIQAISIGLVLEGKDVIAKAETGTGKTLAFGAPMIARMDPERSTVLGMVLCPTRELAQQVAEVLEALGKARGLTVALLVGGDKIDPQIRALKAGAQVIVGTPGRVLDLYNQRFLQFPWTETVVLDEADKMFEIGFIDDIRKILSFTPEERQTLLFSATFPPEVLLLAREQTTNPSEIATAKGTSTVTNIDQIFIPMSEDDCPMALMRMLEQSAKEEVFLVFCERRTDVDKLLRRFERLPFMVKALHGGYDQAARFRVMTAFRTGEVKALIATDVAARGLDVNHVTHVINFAVPRELEDYTHRIGRTGRAGRDGTAITFVTPRDSRRWREMTSGVDWEIREGELPRRGRPDHSRDRGSRQDERPRGRQREEQRPAREESRPRREERDERPVRREREESRPRREEGDKSPRGRQREEQRPAREESRPRREERDERPVRREREESR